MSDPADQALLAMRTRAQGNEHAERAVAKVDGFKAELVEMADQLHEDGYRPEVVGERLRDRKAEMAAELQADYEQFAEEIEATRPQVPDMVHEVAPEDQRTLLEAYKGLPDSERSDMLKRLHEQPRLAVAIASIPQSDLWAHGISPAIWDRANHIARGSERGRGGYLPRNQAQADKFEHASAFLRGYAGVVRGFSR